ncbi:MAG: chromate transporter, partial [Muribaculaceae bacterium]|nr:chromate transporter [Muribaculaceae bacterium]
GDNFGTTQPEVITSIVICAAAFVLVKFVKMHPIWVICLAGLAGFIIY